MDAGRSSNVGDLFTTGKEKTCRYSASCIIECKQSNSDTIDVTRGTTDRSVNSNAESTDNMGYSLCRDISLGAGVFTLESWRHPDRTGQDRGIYVPDAVFWRRAINAISG